MGRWGCLIVASVAACSSNNQTSTTPDAGADLAVAVEDMAVGVPDGGGEDLTGADLTPDLLPLPCSDDEALCANCAARMCLGASNVSGAGILLRTPGLGAVTLSGTVDGGTGGAAFDTDTGAIAGVRAANADPAVYSVVDQIGFVRRSQGVSPPPTPSPVPLAVWVFGSLTVDEGRIAFTGNAASALLSAGDLTVGADALLDVAANGQAKGAGGYQGGYILLPDPHYGTNGLGCAGGRGSELTSGGEGGGGGFGSSGTNNQNTDGGMAVDCEPFGSLVPLIGGSGGGGGSTSTSTASPDILFGGGGGGALQLSAWGTLTLHGRLSAGGGAARTPQGNGRQGSGGGAGGGLLLEAPATVIGPTAGIFANGGGGSSQSAGTGAGTCSVAAQDAHLSSVAATGGTCSPQNTSAGGSGAAGATEATNGINNGGGGGGFGRVVLRKRTATDPVIDAAAQLSPPRTHPAFRTVGP